MSSPSYTCWALADDWRPGFVILGANADHIPTPPPKSPAIIGADGFWGAHEWTVYPQPYHPEFPYLTWIPLRQSDTPDIFTCSVDKSMWQDHPENPNVRVITPTLLGKLTKEWVSIKAAIQVPFRTISSDVTFSSIWHPMEAYIRAFAALSQLEMDFGAWRDFVEVLRNLQQSLLELLAFLDWWKDICPGNSFHSPIHAPTWGAIFIDAQLYENHTCTVRAFLLVTKSSFVLDSTKEVVLSPRTLCNAQPMSLQPPLHSLEHWYYPPLVQDIVMGLETASREIVDNKKKDENGHRVKRAKSIADSLVAQPNNQELRRLTDAGAAPDWFLGTQEVWMHAMNHVSHLDLPSQKSPHRFVLPPIHLFWGCEPQNQHIYYYHYLLLFNEIKKHPERNLPMLTTQEWRSILGNSYWKKQWPQSGKNNPSTFDPDAFWKYGALSFLAMSEVPMLMQVIITPQAKCLAVVVIYYLNSFHVYEEIKEMEHLQFPTTFEKRWAGLRLELDQIVKMWDPSGGGVNPDFFCNKKVWRSWVRAVCKVMADWDGFEHWDWGRFSNVRNMGLNKLLGPDFEKFTKPQPETEPRALSLIAPDTTHATVATDQPDPRALNSYNDAAAVGYAQPACDDGTDSINHEVMTTTMTMRMKNATTICNEFGDGGGGGGGSADDKGDSIITLQNEFCFK
ncbi:hypothetical protein EI94DRAFT_1829080 [Lactarius quietus]|nr:hypothetical protein EI94DRAFT_1829080 [Lactarius quietus]